MSRIITNTNIIVDDFSFCKSFPKNTFIHFLTHFHTDHYEGLSPLWDYGPIYCTHLTKKFILNKYPKIKNIFQCEFYKENIIEIKQGLKVAFWFFDAKHIPGSAMILFQGYMGSIMFTGDFRYNFDMVKQNTIFFPPQKRNRLNKKQLVEQMSGISLHVDELIFDNTYCNEFFKFGVESEILQMMIELIEKNSEKKLIYIAMGALGKHKILVEIAKKFQTEIIVSSKQLQKIKIAGLSTDFFSTNPNDSRIQLISKKNRAQIIRQTKLSPIGNDFICIDTDFLMLEHQSPDKINYIVPYSLHSNYAEMQTFIRMVNPCILRKIVIPFANFRHIKLKMKIDHRLKFSKYLDFVEFKLHRSQSGYANLVRKYTEIYKLSETFLQWFSPKKQEELRKKLGVGQQNHNLRKRPIRLEEQQDNSQSYRQKKPSRKSIADTLNAAHKNVSIEDSFSIASQQNFSQRYSDVFSQKKQNPEEQQQEQETQTRKSIRFYSQKTSIQSEDEDNFLI